MGLWAGLAEKSQEADHSGARPVTCQKDRAPIVHHKGRASRDWVLAYLKLSYNEVAPDRVVAEMGYGKQDCVSACRSPPDETETSAAARLCYALR